MNTVVSKNPATGEIIGEVAVSTLAEIIAQVESAQQAKTAWKMRGSVERAQQLSPLYTLIEQHKEEIARLISQEMGKPITQAYAEVQWSKDYLQDFIENGPKYLANEITFKDQNNLHQVVYEPYGVAACIIPWNFPFSNFVVSVIPLLIAGNTVVFKHSEECVLMGQLISRLMHHLNLPKGVFNQVFGAGEVGQWLVEQAIDLISFTGSSKTGKALSAIAGEKQIKIVLEMGGSDPAVVFDDVRVEDIIPVIFSRRFDNCGQVCCAVKRLIVHQDNYNTVVDLLVDYLRQVKIGDPLDKKTQLGPLASPRQLELLESQVQRSVAQGAKIAIGGERPKNFPGAYYLPTLITHIDTKMPIWREEIFGPVLPVIAFKTEEEAIRLANDTVYGLSGVVFSNDVTRAKRVALQIDAGCVDINLASHWLPCNPFGGYKASGMGRIYGKYGFQELCQIKVIASPL